MLFSHLTVHVCGLGDSSYPKYNVCGRKVWIRCLQLGAHEGHRGEVDEMAQGGGERWFDIWSRNVLGDITGKDFNDEKGLIGGQYTENEASYNPIYNLEFIGENGTELPFLKDNGEYCELIASETLTKNNHQPSVFKYSFKTDEQYSLGDTLQIHPSNPAISIDKFLKYQKLTQKQNEIIKITSPPELIPERGWHNNGTMTFKELLKFHLPIASPPPRRFFSIVWRYASDLNQREKLYELAQWDETDQLFNYIYRSKRTLIEVLDEFDSLIVPLNIWIDAIGLIKGREYTISSKPGQPLVEITATTVSYSTILHIPRIGITTAYLSNQALLQPSQQIPAHIIHKNMQFDKLNGEQGGKYLIICTGAGISGAKGLIECLPHNDFGVNQIMLFTGHRYSHKDFLYYDEFAKFIKQGAKLEIFGCFSKDDSVVDANDKIHYDPKYVQVNLWKYKDQVRAYLKDGNSVIYVCGSSGKMPTEVRITLGEIMKDLDENWVTNKTKMGKYIEDVW